MGKRIEKLKIFLGICIVIVIVLAIFIFKEKELNRDAISCELENTFGKEMVLGVHDMGDGLVSSVVFVTGIHKNEGAYLNAMSKTRDFMSKISKYKPRSINEINIIIGIKNSLTDRDIIAEIEIDTSKLKVVDWNRINNYDDFKKYIKISLQ